MGAAVDNVHHRHRQKPCLGAADVAIQRQFRFLGRGLGDRQADPEDGVGTKATLVGSPVQIDHGLIDLYLVDSLHTGDGVKDLAVDGSNGLGNTLSSIAAHVAVAQFNGFVNTGGSARRHGGPSPGAGFQGHIDLYRGIATAIQDLARGNVNDGSHLVKAPLPCAAVYYRLSIGRSVLVDRIPSGERRKLIPPSLLPGKHAASPKVTSQGSAEARSRSLQVSPWPNGRNQATPQQQPATD